MIEKEKRMKKILLIICLFLLCSCTKQDEEPQDAYFVDVSLGEQVMSLQVQNKTGQKHTLQLNYYIKYYDLDHEELVYTIDDLEVDHTVNLKDVGVLEHTSPVPLHEIIAHYYGYVEAEKVEIIDETGKKTIQEKKYNGADVSKDDLFYNYYVYVGLTPFHTADVRIQNKTSESHQLQMNYMIQFSGSNEYTPVFSKENIKVENSVFYQDEPIIENSIPYEMNEFFAKRFQYIEAIKIEVIDETGRVYVHEQQKDE